MSEARWFLFAYVRFCAYGFVIVVAVLAAAAGLGMVAGDLLQEALERGA